MLMRFDPFRELDRLSAWNSWNGGLGRAGLMAMDAYRHGDDYVVQFDLPGIDPSSIDLTVEKNSLTLRAERNYEPTEDDQVVVAERPQGTFSRQLYLGEGLDLDHVDARYDNGVLTVTIPVAATAKPRRVEIAAGDGAKAIEAQSAAA